MVFFGMEGSIMGQIGHGSFTVLSASEEAMVVAFRRHTLLPRDDCLYALQPSIPHLTRSALHRCLRRHGIAEQCPERVASGCRR